MLLITNEVNPLIFRCVCFVCNTNYIFPTPPYLDPIITRSRAREMSTNMPLTPEVSPAEFVQMKEQMLELVRMVQ